MAHRSSAPGLRAARLILKSYTIKVRSPEELVSGRVPGLKADEAHLSTVIDYATNVFHIADLRLELGYWTRTLHAGNAKAPQIAAFFKKLLDGFSSVPNYKQTDQKLMTTLSLPLAFKNSKPEQVILSKACLEASRFVYHYYHVAPKQGEADEQKDRMEVAKLADTAMGLRRAMEAAPIANYAYERMKRGEATQEEIQACLRKIGILFEFLPNYEDRREESMLLIT